MCGDDGGVVIVLDVKGMRASLSSHDEREGDAGGVVVQLDAMG
jgi:hypothetical protein